MRMDRSSPWWLPVLLLAGACRLGAEDAPENPARPGPGLENGASWLVEGWANGGRIERLNSGGRTTLALHYKTGDKDRTAFKFVPGFHSPDNRFTASIYADADGGPPVAIALSTGTKYVWHESKPIALKKGWNALSIPLGAPHWKTAASKWEFGVGVEPPDDIRAVTVMVLGGKAAGRIYLDGVCPEPERTANEKRLDTEDGWRESWKRMARLGSGFIVWQSSRTGRWRIWRRDLDGTNERQLSPDEGDRDHSSAHISPDGTRIVYISLPPGQLQGVPNNDPKIAWPLYVVNADGSGHRRIADNARTYHGERCAVWIDNDTLLYMGGNGATRRMNLKTGESVALFMENGTKDPWLPDATQRFATRGYPPAFSHFDAAAQKISPLISAEGCQGYFTQDGNWGFWMAGSGGPVRVFNTTTLEQRSLLNRRDARMPNDRNYLYFPMIARSGRLICFGASRNQHDHYHADYDIFVAEFDPASMELAGKPVRYTFDTHPDTYPDAFLKPHELGTLRGEAPFTARFTLEGDAAGWQWEYGDGATGAAPNHVYTQAGDYPVTARNAAGTRRGFVTVLPAAPPRITQSALSGHQTVRIDFDEEIDVRDAVCKNAAGETLPNLRLLPSQRSLEVQLPARAEKPETLALSGVRDRAATPNLMPTQSITVYPNVWPASRAGARFLWEAGNKPNTVEIDGTPRTFTLAPSGRAVFDQAFRMQLNGGRFSVKNLDLGAAPALTVEMTLWPGTVQGETATVFEFCTERGESELALVQIQGRWRVRLKGSEAAALGPAPEHGPAHILLKFENGAVAWRLNGVALPVESRGETPFDARAVKSLHLGANAAGANAWTGRIEGVALYARALDESESKENFARIGSVLAVRQTPPHIELEVVLRKASKVPAMKEIQPYRSGLFCVEYDVARVISGTFDNKTVRVIHWALLDGQPTAAAKHKPGERTALLLEPSAVQRQIEAYRCSNDWADDLDTETYFDTGL